MLSALATAMRRVLDMLVAAGKPVDPLIFAALELVQRKARGETVSKAALDAAWKNVDRMAEAQRQWAGDELRKRFYWAVGQTAPVIRMAMTNENHLDLVLRQGSYGMVTGDEDVLRAWYEEAFAASTASTALPKPKRVDPKKAAAEAKALARIAKALGAQGKLVAAKAARHDARRTADAATVKKLLARKNYPAHASVLAFEKMFGGLVIPEDGGNNDEDWFADGPATLVGAYACLKSDGHDRPTGGRDDLVPVAYTPNDGIMFLDKAGATYFEDTIEDLVAARWKRTGAAAIAELLKTS